MPSIAFPFACDLLKGLERFLISALVLSVLFLIRAQAQIPFFTNGPDSSFSQTDFAQMYLDEQRQKSSRNAAQQAERQKLVNSGAVSALDLAAPNKAIDAFNRAATLMKQQKSKEAITHLQKAIAVYPKFVSAHNALGVAYLDQDDPRAKSEFEAAAQLDQKFAGSFLNLGFLALSQKDFATAQSNLEKAAGLNPKDAKTLSALAFAQNGNRDYEQALNTAQRVHALDHHGIANIHYLAASAAVALNDMGTVQAQLNIFLAEDPTNPLAPTARQNLDLLARAKNGAASIPTSGARLQAASASESHSLANSDRLKEQLAGLNAESTGSPCDNCAAADESEPASANGNGGASAPRLPASDPRSWTIRKTVDETALFFAVSSHGHMIGDLDLADIKLLDNSKPPDRVVQFIPQSKLPLRLALVIDTSGSVQDRFTFEKHAAEKFFEKVLNGTTDLAFVAGFNSEIAVTQDFSAESQKLVDGIEKLKNSGGTALFDALSYACWKLAAYPEQQRVARVAVVLTDGEDNSSHRSLKQTLRDAEDAGVTVYVVSTKESSGPKTDVDRILEAIAERSGGEAMFPGDVLALHKYLDKLRDLIRSRYLLAYKPADFEPNGRYRKITLTARKDGKHLQVHARKGYFARVEPSHN